MNHVKLEQLGIDLDVPDDLFYHDDGPVESIHLHSNRLRFNYGKSIVYEYGEEPLGIIKFFYNPPNTHAHVYYKTDLGHFPTISVRAHEETHFLHLIDEKIDKFNLLTEKIEEFEGFQIDPSWLKREDREFVAYIGSIFALRKEGFDIPPLKNSQTDKQLTRAHKFYQNLRVGKINQTTK